MQGTVLAYNDGDGKGLISGDDGERYAFTRADLQQLKPLEAGMRVDFRREDQAAREIFLIDNAGPGTTGAPPTTPTPQQSYPFMEVMEGHPSIRHHIGMWGYFMKCMGMYFNGNGRATRGEYWSFVLFSWLFIIIPGALGLLVAGPDFYDYGDDPSPAATGLFILTGLAYIAVIVPGITVMIRRLHDQGLSGWLYLLCLIPYIGGLVLFIMSLIPGQRGPNKHGPDPQASRPGYSENPA